MRIPKKAVATRGACSPKGGAPRRPRLAVQEANPSLTAALPDTVSRVIHCRGRRAAAKPSSSAAPAVNNFAESEAELVKNLPLANDGRVRKAPRPARSALPSPSRVQGRSPAGSRADVQRSERTTSHEDSCIRSTSDEPPTSLQPQQNRIVKMQSWSKITHYAGFDWAHDHHDVVIVNGSGKIVADFQIEHTAQGWQRWREQVAALGPELAACVETNQGFVVEQLLESGVAVYPISTTSAIGYRQRKVPSGNKTDHLDAWSLAPMPCASMATVGKRCPKKIPWWPSCAYSAATRSP
jgi:Transposase